MRDKVRALYDRQHNTRAFFEHYERGGSGAGGMSGSPVVDDGGSAIAVVSIGGGTKVSPCRCRNILDTLSGWLLGPDHTNVPRRPRHARPEWLTSADASQARKTQPVSIGY